MSAGIRRAVPVALSATLLVGMGGQLAGEEISRDYHETFDVHAGMRLHLDHGDGDVSISPWEQDSLDIVVRYRAKASNVGWVKSTDFEVEFREFADRIEVIGKGPKRVSIGYSNYREYEHSYTVKAPSYLKLALEGDDGDVEIESWRAPVEVKLEDGDVKLTDIESSLTVITLEDGDLEIDRLEGRLVVEVEDGDVEIYDCRSDAGRVRAEDGDVTIERGDGNFEISSEDGDLRLSGLVARTLEIRSGDGNVEVELLPVDGPDVDIRVDDGNVRVDLAEGISATFEIESRDGRIRVGGSGVEDLQQEKHRTTGRFGDGGGRIYVRTADGSVTLRQ